MDRQAIGDESMRQELRVMDRSLALDKGQLNDASADHQVKIMSRFARPGTTCRDPWEDINRSCPVCQRKGFSTQALALHVNACLDETSSGTGPAIATRTNSVCKEDEKGSGAKARSKRGQHHRGRSLSKVTTMDVDSSTPIAKDNRAGCAPVSLKLPAKGSLAASPLMQRLRMDGFASQLESQGTKGVQNPPRVAETGPSQLRGLHLPSGAGDVPQDATPVTSTKRQDEQHVGHDRDHVANSTGPFVGEKSVGDDEAASECARTRLFPRWFAGDPALLEAHQPHKVKNGLARAVTCAFDIGHRDQMTRRGPGCCKIACGRTAILSRGRCRPGARLTSWGARPCEDQLGWFCTMPHAFAGDSWGEGDNFIDLRPFPLQKKTTDLRSPCAYDEEGDVLGRPSLEVQALMPYDTSSRLERFLNIFSMLQPARTAMNLVANQLVFSTERESPPRLELLQRRLKLKQSSAEAQSSTPKIDDSVKAPAQPSTSPDDTKSVAESHQDGNDRGGNLCSVVSEATRPKAGADEARSRTKTTMRTVAMKIGEGWPVPDGGSPPSVLLHSSPRRHQLQENLARHQGGATLQKVQRHCRHSNFESTHGRLTWGRTIGKSDTTRIAVKSTSAIPSPVAPSRTADFHEEDVTSASNDACAWRRATLHAAEASAEDCQRQFSVKDEEEGSQKTCGPEALTKMCEEQPCGHPEVCSPSKDASTASRRIGAARALPSVSSPTVQKRSGAIDVGEADEWKAHRVLLKKPVRNEPFESDSYLANFPPRTGHRANIPQQGSLTIVDKDHGATLRSSWSIDDSREVGKLKFKDTVRYDAVWFYPPADQDCVGVLRYRVVPHPLLAPMVRGQHLFLHQIHQQFPLSWQICVEGLFAADLLGVFLLIGVIHMNGMNKDALLEDGGWISDRGRLRDDPYIIAEEASPVGVRSATIDGATKACPAPCGAARSIDRDQDRRETVNKDLPGCVPEPVSSSINSWIATAIVRGGKSASDRRRVTKGASTNANRSVAALHRASSQNVPRFNESGPQAAVSTRQSRASDRPSGVSLQEGFSPKVHDNGEVRALNHSDVDQCSEVGATSPQDTTTTCLSGAKRKLHASALANAADTGGSPASSHPAECPICRLSFDGRQGRWEQAIHIQQFLESLSLEGAFESAE